MENVKMNVLDIKLCRLEIIVILRNWLKIKVLKKESMYTYTQRQAKSSAKYIWKSKNTKQN